MPTRDDEAADRRRNNALVAQGGLRAWLEMTAPGRVPLLVRDAVDDDGVYRVELSFPTLPFDSERWFRVFLTDVTDD